MSSALAQAPEALPNPPTFKPKNNPAFILHGALKTSYEEVGPARVLPAASRVDTHQPHA
jgi:hypothetical protein